MKKTPIKNIILITFNSVVLIYTLFSYFLCFEFGFLGFIINLLILFTYIFISFFLIIGFIISAIETKNKTFLGIQLIFLIMVCIASEFNFILNIPENIALFIKMPLIEKEVNDYIHTGHKSERIRDEEYVCYVWDPGFLDHRSAVVYDPDNRLEGAVTALKENDKEAFNTYKNLLGGYLHYIKKIKNKYYLCYF